MQIPDMKVKEVIRLLEKLGGHVKYDHPQQEKKEVDEMVTYLKNRFGPAKPRRVDDADRSHF